MGLGRAGSSYIRFVNRQEMAMPSTVSHEMNFVFSAGGRAASYIIPVGSNWLSNQYSAVCRERTNSRYKLLFDTPNGWTTGGDGQSMTW